MVLNDARLLITRGIHRNEVLSLVSDLVLFAILQSWSRHRSIIPKPEDSSRLHIGKTRNSSRRFIRHHWYTHGIFEGVLPLLERRYHETDSDEMRESYENYMTEIPCKACHGARLKPETLAVTFGEKNIYEVTQMTIREADDFLMGVPLTQREQKIAGQILKEIHARLTFLLNVGLDYLTLSRAAGTLSGGEAQRIRLATQIGSGLQGVLYVLDEPSIGLHQRDNNRLLATLKHLRDLGNTLIVVEHDEDTMLAADHIIDIGPGAGANGGQVVAQGTAQEIMQVPQSITGAYLSRRKFIPVPSRRRPGNGEFLEVVGAAENNLKNLSVKFPLGTLTLVTGVSGSGKSTLVNEILYKGIASRLYHAKGKPGRHKAIRGLENIDKIIEYKMTDKDKELFEEYKQQLIEEGELSE